MALPLQSSRLTKNQSSVPCLQLGFVLLASIWEYDFPPFMVLVIAILNDGDAFLNLSSKI
jgi:hypothetical protein